jgi:hypothetical protein
VFKQGHWKTVRPAAPRRCARGPRRAVPPTRAPTRPLPRSRAPRLRAPRAPHPESPGVAPRRDVPATSGRASRSSARQGRKSPIRATGLLVARSCILHHVVAAPPGTLSSSSCSSSELAQPSDTSSPCPCTTCSSPAHSILPPSRRLAGAGLPAAAARLCRGVPLPARPQLQPSPQTGRRRVPSHPPHLPRPTRTAGRPGRPNCEPPVISRGSAAK